MEKYKDGNLVDLSTIITDVLNVVFSENDDNDNEFVENVEGV